MSVQKNTLYLLNIWIPLTLILVLAIAVCLSHGLIGWVLLAVVPIFTAICIRQQSAKFNAQMTTWLRQDNLAALGDFFEQNATRINTPTGNVVRALAVGQIYAFYGQFDRVRAQIDSVNWQSRPPMQAAGQLTLLCLLQYFESRDYELGLSMARQARELGKSPLIFPGARQAKKAFDTYVAIGEILTKTANRDTIRNLETKLAKANTLYRPLIAWGLAVAYSQSDRQAKLTEMRSLIRSTAPYCKSLTTLPE